MTSGSGTPGALRAGDEVGNYVIENLLGEGGFGAVYRARNRVTRKVVAIKVLSAQAAALSPEVRVRFRREAAAANEIGHENFVEAFDFGEIGDQPYIVLEFLDGVSLDQDVRSNGPMSVARAARITVQMADALGAAHRCAIVHRDVKPENIFLVRRAGREDFVKILDLGIAKFIGETTDAFKTKTTAILGSPSTMSPEQCRGARIDHRSDIYSLGIVLFFVLTGRYPFTGEFTGDILSGHMRDPPPPLRSFAPELPPALEEVVARCLAKQADDRYQTMGDLARALVPFEGSVETHAAIGAQRPAAPVTQMPHARRPIDPRSDAARRRRALRVATAGAGLLVGGITIALVVSASHKVSRDDQRESTRASRSGQSGAEASAPEPEKKLDAPVVPPAPRAVPVDPAPPPAATHEPAPADGAGRVRPEPARGRIDIFSDPWATVFIDGRRAGDTPLRQFSLPVGPHRIRLVNPAAGRPAAHPYEVVIAIKPGANKPLDVELTR